VPPQADAVRLIHREKAHTRAPQRMQKRLLPQTFRGGVDQLVASLRDAIQSPLDLLTLN
jgi:hypothetical protein